MAKEKMMTIRSSQIISPIRDIKDGIIVTKDGRFVKLMEFSPINFSLRSSFEQDGIVSSFAKVLKAMPRRIQFKVVSRKADVSNFVENIQKEMEAESNENCRILQQEQIQLITEVGAEQGVTRRFFLCFEYEEKKGLTKKPTFEQISFQLHNYANSIRSAMAQCGNEELSISYNDEYTLSVLYSIMSRNESENRTYKEREFEVVARYAGVDGVDFSKAVHIPINDFIAPAVIDAKTSPKYIVIDGMYYSYCYLPSSTYPMYARAGWLSLLVNMGEGVDVDFFVKKEDTASVQRKLQNHLKFNRVKLKDTEDTSQDFDSLRAAITSGYYIKEGVATGDELCYMSTMITITAHSLEELNWKYDEIKRILVGYDLRLKPCLFQQMDAFKASLPICNYDEGIFAKSKRNILTSSLASAYPFVSYEMSDENGILLGSNSSNNSLVFLNNFDTSKYFNANMSILGASGSGKTFALQLMALRMRQKQIQVFIIAPHKGHEFKRACDAVGGQFVTIAPGSGHNINIMEIRKKDESANLLIDGEGTANESILAGKIQQLHSFFSLLVPDITYEEKQFLDEALVNTYKRFGITSKNKSLYDPMDNSRYRKMPILGDLHSELKNMGEGTKRLHNILGRYVTGSASSFNAPTNVNLDNKYIVLDVSTLTKEMLPVGMFLALDYVWDKAREDRSARKVIFVDETWKLIGPSSSAQAAEFVLDIFKVIRGYGGSAVAATQDLNDFFALEDGRFGKGIINNSKIKLLLRPEVQEATRLAEALDLTSSEVSQITQMERGTALLVANTNHIFIEIKASMTEYMLITSDPNDLRKQAQQRSEAL